jgi:hypothetical protein
MRGEAHGAHLLRRREKPVVPVLYELVHRPAITGDDWYTGV